MQHMIEDLLHYSRVSSSFHVLDSVDLSDIMSDALGRLSQAIFDSSADINYDDLPHIDCNPKQIEILFAHLIENSILHCDSQPRLSVTAEKQDHCWLLSFEDNGVGVQRDLWEKIFEPFDRSRSESDKRGIGVGLATCKKIAKIHNGEIWLESNANQGSTVFVKLPERTVVISDDAVLC